MPDLPSIVQAALKSCAANVGPLIGVELEIGEFETETSETIPEGELAVLPLSLRSDDDQPAADDPVVGLTLSVPIHELVTLGRRMAGDEEPDKEREISGEDLGACAEVLTVMGSAIAESFREQLRGLELEAGAWWSTSEPQEAAFPDGTHLCGKTTVDVPGGTAVELTLRVPDSVLEQTLGVQAAADRGEVLLVGVATELVQTLQPILDAAELNVALADPDAEEVTQSYETADLLLLSDDRDDALALLGSLRKADSTWRKPSILCMREPTRDSVVRAMENGASYVLKLPTSTAELQSALATLRSD